MYSLDHFIWITQPDLKSPSAFMQKINWPFCTFPIKKDLQVRQSFDRWILMRSVMPLSLTLKTAHCWDKGLWKMESEYWLSCHKILLKIATTGSLYMSIINKLLLNDIFQHILLVNFQANQDTLSTHSTHAVKFIIDIVATFYSG